MREVLIAVVVVVAMLGIAFTVASLAHNGRAESSDPPQPASTEEAPPLEAINAVAAGTDGALTVTRWRDGDFLCWTVSAYWPAGFTDERAVGAAISCLPAPPVKVEAGP